MIKSAFFFVALATAAAAPAAAQDGGGWVVSVGPGIAYQPAFPGADEMEVGFWPIIGVRRQGSERRFQTPDDSFGVSLTGDTRFRFGPSLEIQPGRDEEDIPGLEEVGTSVEAGAFVEAFAGSFRFRADVRKGVGGHKGLIADVGADFVAGDPDDVAHFSIGPRVRFVNDRYVRAFYGVTPEEVGPSGLVAYDPKGGFHSAGALAFAEYKLSPRFAVQGYGRYDRLYGDAADSPIVRSEYGSRNQYEVGAGITYTFNIN